MISVASTNRAERSGHFGQDPIAACSFKASPEPTPRKIRPGIQQTQRRKRLSDDGWIVAKGRARDRRSYPDSAGAFADRAHRDPRLTRVTFVGLPGLQMIAGGQQIESCLFGGHAQLHEFRNGKLFVREHETHHGLMYGRCGSGGATSGRSESIQKTYLMPSLGLWMLERTRRRAFPLISAECGGWDRLSRFRFWMISF